jgi:hypothetical protein
MDTTAGSGFSASVELHQQVNGSRISLSHVGRDELIFREPQSIPPETEGTLTVKIDNYQKCQTVVLYDGATPGSKRAQFRRCSGPADR